MILRRKVSQERWSGRRERRLSPGTDVSSAASGQFHGVSAREESFPRERYQLVNYVRSFREYQALPVYFSLPS